MFSHPRFVRWVSCWVSLFMGFGLVAGLDMLMRLPVALAAGPITVTTFNDELNSDGDCSLREAIQAANTDAAVDACPPGSGADTIIIPAGTYTLTIAGQNEDLNATGDLDITGTLTLSGADMATTIINANALDRVLHVVPLGTVSLTLFNLTVYNGKAANSGGGLEAGGTVVMSNTTFVSNTVTSGVGGGAYFVIAAILTDTTFISNTAAQGGGVFFASSGIIRNTTFVSNTAYGNSQSGCGGGAYFVGPAIVTDTTFISNTGCSGGGAYFNFRAMVTGTGFIGNSANNGGGAWFNSTATVTGTTFVSNTASDDGGGAWFYGIATVAGTTFINNAGTFGGGAWFHGAAIVTDMTFINNTAGAGGGVNFRGAATVASTTFVSNTASDGRGGGASFGGVAMVTGTTFISNTAYSGGGAYFYSRATVTGATFSSNIASDGGGAYFDYGTPATLTDTTFTRNTAVNFGGGAYFYGGATVMGATFLSNTAYSGGGAYFYGRFNIVAGNFVNTLFAANRADSNQGAGLYAENFDGDDVMTLRHVTIVSPTVGSGSAVYMLSGTVNITNSIVASYSVALEQATGVLNENHNLFSNVATPYSGTVVSGGNSITGTMAFADTTLYRLTSDSVAIDAGTDVGIASDFEGDLRPTGAGFDIGWDEFVVINGLSANNDSPKQVVQPVHFTATISTGTGVSYQWNFGDNSPLSNLPSPTHFYIVPGNYTAIVTATNSVGSASASTPVTITEAAFKLYLPLITKSPSAAANAPTLPTVRELVGRWAWRRPDL